MESKDPEVLALQCTLPGQADGKYLALVNLNGGEPTSLNVGGESISSPAFSPDGASIAYSRADVAGGPASIYRIDVDASASPVPLTEAVAGSGDLAPAWSPTGDRIVFVREFDVIPGSDDADADIFVIGRAGGVAQQVTSGEARDRAPSWSADGERIAFWRVPRAANGRLWVMDDDGGNPRQLPLSGEDTAIHGPVWAHR